MIVAEMITLRNMYQNAHIEGFFSTCNTFPPRSRVFANHDERAAMENERTPSIRRLTDSIM